MLPEQALNPSTGGVYLAPFLVLEHCRTSYPIAYALLTAGVTLEGVRFLHTVSANTVLGERYGGRVVHTWTDHILRKVPRTPRKGDAIPIAL